jgi:hypothetical protein
MSNDALILRLSADLTPVRRYSPWREAGLLAAVCAIELALVLGAGLMRPDMARAIGSVFMLWKLGGLAVLALASGGAAVRSFSPMAAPGRGPRLVLVLVGVMVVAGAFVGSYGSRGGALLDRLAPGHGLLCALSIVVMAAPILAVLRVLMQRGAPTHPRGSALAAGMAAATSGALIFAFCCRYNDPLYVVVWYAVGCMAVTGLARWLLPVRFRL